MGGPKRAGAPARQARPHIVRECPIDRPRGCAVARPPPSHPYPPRLHTHPPPSLRPHPPPSAVYADGQICLDILQNAWSPIYDVSAVLTSIQSLLCDPNPNSPANSEAAKLFSENRGEYDKRVRTCVEESWA